VAAPDKWRREIKSPAFSQTAVQNGSKYYESNSSDYLPFWIHELVQESVDPVPTEQLKNENVVRVARGQVDERNRPITGQAYWFDSNDLLHAAYSDPNTTSYQDFQPWNGKQVPRLIELKRDEVSLIRFTIDLLEPPPHSLAESLFLPKDVQPQIITDADDYKGPVMVKPKPIYQVKPDNPQSGHGTVLVSIQLDQHGHVVNAKIRQSAGQALDDAALLAATQWEFSPMQIHGKPVPTTTVLRFDF
jgi:TonB family protein